MATVTKQWCSWDSDEGTVSYSYDDTVSAGFPHGKLTAFVWANSSVDQQLITITLEPGTTASDLSGSVTSIPLAAATLTPTPNGATVAIAGVNFTASGNSPTGSTSITVTAQDPGTTIPAGSQVEVPLPTLTIPASGGTATLPVFYGGGTVNSSGSVSVSGFGVPMQQITTPHGTFVAIPANLDCAGN